MHSIRKRTDELGNEIWQVLFVGHAFDSDPVRIIATFAAADDACAWVSYLNGGSKPTGPFPHDPDPFPTGG